jgi:hypothetical protein
MAKDSIKITQPAIKIGVKRLGFAMVHSNAEPQPASIPMQGQRLQLCRSQDRWFSLETQQHGQQIGIFNRLGQIAVKPQSQGTALVLLIRIG